LQLGREAMDERLAVVASSKEDLTEKLDAYMNEGRGAKGLHLGNKRSGSEAVVAAPRAAVLEMK